LALKLKSFSTAASLGSPAMASALSKVGRVDNAIGLKPLVFPPATMPSRMMGRSDAAFSASVRRSTLMAP